MKYGSVCSGIEAATVAWHPLGWKPAFLSEIDKFPRAVLTHHYPHVPLHGDFTTIREGEYEPIDLLVGGTPCQSFSIAGLRGGLGDARGNLALAFLQLARRSRARWLVWENVPGVLSSNGGRDFGSILGGMVELGYGYSYRVLDAQYFGVAQRRRRVFVVGYLGDWRRAAAVLFERESLRWDSPPSRKTREGIAPTISARPTGGGGLGTDFDLDGGLIAKCLNGKGGAGRIDGESETSVTHSLRADGFDASEDETGRGTPLVPVNYPEIPDSSIISFSAKDHGADAANDLAPTIRAGGHTKSHANAGVMPAVAYGFDGTNDGSDATEGASPTLRAQTKGGQNAPAVAVALRGRDGGATAELSDIPPALRASQGGGDKARVLTSAVRRLTPRECERLQGFPEIHKEVIIRICKNEDERLAIASSAGRHSAARNHAQSAPADVLVLIDLERQHLQLLSAGRLIWSANVAERPNASPLLLPVADFVRVVALMTSTAVPGTPTGRAASPLITPPSSHHQIGSAFVPVSGQEIAALVSDAGRFTAEVDLCMKSITSPVGPISPNYGSTLRTLSCCVSAAISSCIRDQIASGSSFTIKAETHQGYTAIPYRGKPAADGPRYKALGNSMAVPVMRWIGERIQMVDQLETMRAA